MKTKCFITPFAIDIIERFAHLHIISFTDDKLIAYDKRNNKAHFFYEISEDCSFHFNLLSECNNAATKWFKSIITLLHFKLDIKETKNDYFNTLEKVY